jgi:hypothetical protein
MTGWPALIGAYTILAWGVLWWLLKRHGLARSNHRGLYMTTAILLTGASLAIGFREWGWVYLAVFVAVAGLAIDRWFNKPSPADERQRVDRLLAEPDEVAEEDGSASFPAYLRYRLLVAATGVLSAVGPAIGLTAGGLDWHLGLSAGVGIGVAITASMLVLWMTEYGAELRRFGMRF